MELFKLTSKTRMISPPEILKQAKIRKTQAKSPINSLPTYVHGKQICVGGSIRIASDRAK